MTHPDDLLAGYVDGSLSGADRTAVDAHLRACARCREEVEFAGSGRAALRRLPDPEALDLAGPVMARLGAEETEAAGPPAWYRVAGIAAAAVIAIAVVVAFPKVGSGPSDDRRAATEDAAAPTVGGAETLSGLTLELQQTDYDIAGVQALAGEYVGRTTPSQTAAGSDATAPIGTRAQAVRARSCVTKAFPDFPGTPTRLISASFEGTPAYLAVVLEGPAPGQPADTVSVWVADHATCAPLSFTTARI